MKAEQISVNSQGVSHIELQIVDENNVPVVQADDEITCDIAGNARLLGMEAGDNLDKGDYTDNKQRAFHGKMIIYIQAKGKAGDELTVRCSAPWLKSSVVKIKLL